MIKASTSFIKYKTCLTEFNGDVIFSTDVREILKYEVSNISPSGIRVVANRNTDMTEQII
jgi:hypothetical protein